MRLTLDTNVLWDAADPSRADHAAAARLLEPHEAGACSLYRVTRVDVDVPFGENGSNCCPCTNRSSRFAIMRRPLASRKSCSDSAPPMPMVPVWANRKAIVVSLLLAVLGATAIVPGTAAHEKNLETSYNGITLIGVPPGPADTYDVPVIGAGQALDNIRAALSLLFEKSSYSAAALDTLKSNGNVVIVYDAAFPPQDVSSIGTDLAAFIPDLLAETPHRKGRRDFPVVVGRYIVKWTTEELAAGLAHELIGHGMQYLHGRLETMSELDSECQAYLYQEMVHQDLGMDKHSRVMVEFRQGLEWRWCIPFKQYMRQHTPDKMALWETLNPDVPQLLTIFEDYLQSTGTP